MAFVVLAEMRSDNPTDGIKLARRKSDGIHTWTESEITRYRATHALGTRARLAFELLLNTAQRRSDVVRMGRQHVRGDLLMVRQQKTGQELDIPIHPDLQAAIAAMSTGDLSFLVTERGQPFTAAGFGNWFREQCDAAGLPERCSAHGLRKAACRRLAEAGCSAHQIAAISGHLSLSEVQRYTKAADQARLARAAMEMLGTGTRTGIGKPKGRFVKNDI
jgi:integrase